jgi:hypothetical protein
VAALCSTSEVAPLHIWSQATKRRDVGAKNNSSYILISEAMGAPRGDASVVNCGICGLLTPSCEILCHRHGISRFTIRTLTRLTYGRSLQTLLHICYRQIGPDNLQTLSSCIHRPRLLKVLKRFLITMAHQASSSGHRSSVAIHYSTGDGLSTSFLNKSLVDRTEHPLPVD